MSDPDTLICTCEDPGWLAQVFVNGDLKDEAIIEASEDREQTQRITDDVRDKHVSLTDVADALGQSWSAKMFCPNCKRGLEWNSDGEARVLDG